VGGEFRVNATTAGAQWSPAITGLSDGSFAVTWASGNQDGSGWGVYARTYTVANTAVAEPDAFTADDNAAIAGNVLVENGSGADRDQTGAALTVAAVNGDATAVGTQITLPSGALLSLNADGTFSYDSNGAFDHLPGADSGASNPTSAIDSFTYSLADGATATVSVTINGSSAGDDRIEGTPGNDMLSGGAGADTIIAYGASTCSTAGAATIRSTAATAGTGRPISLRPRASPSTST
jgi:VCBS repeat-containing protein